MKSKLMGRAGVAWIVLVLVLLPACRRDADDRGVGTSSVGAGGDNGTAPNNTGKAEPVPGTERTTEQPGNRTPPGGDQPAPPPPEESRSSGSK